MNIIWFIVIILVVLVVLFLGLDFTRYVKAAIKQDKDAKLNGVKVDAGGILFIQGNKTYYSMPNGERRKIADRPFDLKAGSKDMNYFLSLMEKARRQIRSEEHAAMESVAKDIVKTMGELGEAAGKDQRERIKEAIKKPIVSRETKENEK